MEEILKHNFKVISEVISIEGLDLYIIEPGIAVSEYHGDIELDLTVGKHVYDSMKKLTGGRAMPQLFIACPGLSVSKEVREWGVTEEALRFTMCTAVVCNSLAHRIIGNFMIRVQRPPRPTRMFSHLNDAVLWLKSSLN